MESLKRAGTRCRDGFGRAGRPRSRGGAKQGDSRQRGRGFRFVPEREGRGTDAELCHQQRHARRGEGCKATRARRAESAGNSPAIKVTDYVKPGDPVLVSYRAADGKNLALAVRPISAVGTTGAAADSTKNIQAK